MKIPDVTIGIPAYNEASNLKRLIPLLSKQNGVNVKKIIISLDGLEDNSAEVVKSISNKNIVVIKNKERKGIARGINQIFNKSNSEYLILLDADISIKDPKYLSRLVLPLVEKRAELVSSKITEEKPVNYFQEVLYLSMRLKENLFSSINGGQNLYTCYGPARAFTKKVYKKLNMPTSVGNDMYTYLFSKVNGFKFLCVEDAKTYYTLPKNLKDHVSQSTRFLNSTDSMNNFFNKSFVNKEVKIPASAALMGAVKSIPLFVMSPDKILGYLFIYFYTKNVSKFKSTSNTWPIATSTKNYE